MIELVFACGHRQKEADDVHVGICQTCGERRVQTVKARAPRFRGVCQGPSATYEALGGIPVTVGAVDGE